MERSALPPPCPPPPPPPPSLLLHDKEAEKKTQQGEKNKKVYISRPCSVTPTHSIRSILEVLAVNKKNKK